MRAEAARKARIAWVREGAYARYGGNVGEVTQNQDSDEEIKLRYFDGSTSGYIKAEALTRSEYDTWRRAVSQHEAEVAAAEAEAQRQQRIAWVQRGAYADYNGKVGQVTQDKDSDEEVKLQWADGSASGYINASCLSESRSGDFDKAKKVVVREQFLIGCDVHVRDSDRNWVAGWVSSHEEHNWNVTYKLGPTHDPSEHAVCFHKTRRNESYGIEDIRHA